MKPLVAQIPNALSVSRIGLAVAFPLLPPPLWAPVVGVALFTEWADGWLARRFGWESRAGTFLDPVADKLFVSMVLLTVVLAGMLAWWEALLIMGRDLVVVGAALWYWVSRAPRFIGKMAPSWSGKVATTLQFASLVALAAGWRWEPLLLWTAATSVYAGVAYIVRFEGRAEERAP